MPKIGRRGSVQRFVRGFARGRVRGRDTPGWIARAGYPGLDFTGLDIPGWIPAWIPGLDPGLHPGLDPGLDIPEGGEASGRRPGHGGEGREGAEAPRWVCERFTWPTQQTAGTS
eukprot:gene6566-biopygen4412